MTELAFAFDVSRRVIGSLRHGSMANALPHAIGAQFADPGRQVISMSGDGGLGMLMGELLTVALHELPVKIVVVNTPARSASNAGRRPPSSRLTAAKIFG